VVADAGSCTVENSLDNNVEGGLRRAVASSMFLLDHGAASVQLPTVRRREVRLAMVPCPRACGAPAPSLRAIAPSACVDLPVLTTVRDRHRSQDALQDTPRVHPGIGLLRHNLSGALDDGRHILAGNEKLGPGCQTRDGECGAYLHAGRFAFAKLKSRGRNAPVVHDPGADDDSTQLRNIPLWE